MEIPAEAVNAILPLCAKVGRIPALAVARELVAFLCLRKQYQDFAVDIPLGVSPGSLIDDVWHKLLLETGLAEDVYNIIGGGSTIHHSAREGNSDHDLMLRRLNAMNCLEALGHQVKPTLWRQAGSVMASITRKRGLYTTRFCTARDMASLTDSLAMFKLFPTKITIIVKTLVCMQGFLEHVRSCVCVLVAK